MNIGFDLGCNLDLEFSRSNMESALSWPKMVRLPQNKKQTYQLNSKPQMWPYGCDLVCDLDLEFSRSNMESAIFRPKMVDCHEIKSKHINWTLSLRCEHRIWPFGICYVSAKDWFDCHRMKSKHIEWTEGLNDNQLWPWPWPWKVRCKDLPDSDLGDFRYRHAVDSSSYQKWCRYISHL